MVLCVRRKKELSRPRLRDFIALGQKQTQDPVAHRPTLYPLSHTSWRACLCPRGMAEGVPSSRCSKKRPRVSAHTMSGHALATVGGKARCESGYVLMTGVGRLLGFLSPFEKSVLSAFSAAVSSDDVNTRDGAGGN